jgi:hypothetical protein
MFVSFVCVRTSSHAVRSSRRAVVSEVLSGYFDGGLFPRPPPDGLPVVLGQLPGPDEPPPLPPPDPFPPPPP